MPEPASGRINACHCVLLVARAAYGARAPEEQRDSRGLSTGAKCIAIVTCVSNHTTWGRGRGQGPRPHTHRALLWKSGVWLSSSPVPPTRPRTHTQRAPHLLGSRGRSLRARVGLVAALLGPASATLARESRIDRILGRTIAKNVGCAMEALSSPPGYEHRRAGGTGAAAPAAIVAEPPRRGARVRAATSAVLPRLLRCTQAWPQEHECPHHSSTTPVRTRHPSCCPPGLGEACMHVAMAPCIHAAIVTKCLQVCALRLAR